MLEYAECTTAITNEEIRFNMIGSDVESIIMWNRY